MLNFNFLRFLELFPPIVFSFGTLHLYIIHFKDMLLFTNIQTIDGVIILSIGITSYL